MSNTFTALTEAKQALDACYFEHRAFPSKASAKALALAEQQFDDALASDRQAADKQPKRTVFARLPIGAKFKFLGNPIPFVKVSDFSAHGYRNGESFIVSSIHQQFDTLSMVDIINNLNGGK